jgi:hypothetical protein
MGIGRLHGIRARGRSEMMMMMMDILWLAVSRVA